MSNVKERARTISIDSKAEYSLRIESSEQFTSSIFAIQYGKALSIVNDVCSATRDYFNSIRDRNHRTESLVQREQPFYNNLFAFMGERGAGKSSILVSFARFLELDVARRNEIIKKLLNTSNNTEAFPILEATFYSIGIIDPSVFHNSADILEVVISRMFEIFKEKVTDIHNSQHYETKRSLLERFQTVHKNLQTLTSDHKEYLQGDSIEVLQKFGSSTRIRENVSMLVEEFIEFIQPVKYGKDQAYLVLAIDDPDQNTSHVYKMFEQLRKYLIIPHLIIMLSARRETLIDAIEHDIISARELDIYRLGASIKESVLADYPREMPGEKAIRYFDKLIPEDRRLILPFSGLRDKKYMIKYDNEVPQQLEKYILNLIAIKTGLIFMPSLGNLHPIVPDNLRYLNNFICMLKDMKSPDWDKVKAFKTKAQSNGTNVEKDRDEQDAYQILVDNFNRFWDFFVYQWIPCNLTSRSMEFVREFITKDNDRKNEFVVSTIDRELARVKASYKNPALFNYDNQEKYSEYFNIVNRANYQHNISLGDVLYVLNHSLRFFDTSEHYDMVFALKTLYSIFLFELCVLGDLSIEPGSSNSSAQNSTDLVKILAGFITNPHEYHLVRESRSHGKRDYFRTQIKVLHKFREHKDNVEFPYINIADAMYLFVSYWGTNNIDIRTGIQVHYREDKKAFYGKNAGSTKNYTYADMNALSVFFNIEDISNLFSEVSEKNKDGQDINDVLKALVKWRMKNALPALPIYSIELLERIMASVNPDLKKPADLLDHFLNLFTGEIPKYLGEELKSLQQDSDIDNNDVDRQAYIANSVPLSYHTWIIETYTDLIKDSGLSKLNGVQSALHNLEPSSLKTLSLQTDVTGTLAGYKETVTKHLNEAKSLQDIINLPFEVIMDLNSADEQQTIYTFIDMVELIVKSLPEETNKDKSEEENRQIHKNKLVYMRLLYVLEYLHRVVRISMKSELGQGKENFSTYKQTVFGRLRKLEMLRAKELKPMSTEDIVNTVFSGFPADLTSQENDTITKLMTDLSNEIRSVKEKNRHTKKDIVDALTKVRRSPLLR